MRPLNSMGFGLQAQLRPPTQGGGYEPEAIALFARSPITVSDAEKARANTRLRRLKASGLLMQMDAVYGFKAEGLASLNWKKDAFNLIASGLITYTDGRGWQGGGGVLRTGFVPSVEAAAGAQFQLNAAMIGIRKRLAAAGLARFLMAANDGSGNYVSIEATSADALVGRVNQASGAGGLNLNGNAPGTSLAVVKRTGATAASGWVDTRRRGGVSTAATGLPAREIYIGGRNSNGVIANASADVFQSAFIGGLISDVQSVQLALIELEYLTDIAAWGDSLTAGAGATVASTNSYPAVASEQMVRDVLNLGIGSQTSTQIAARQGAQPINVTLTGDAIPTSGGVAVTAKNINILFNSGSFTGEATGTIAGVHGTMTTNGTGDWTFTQTTSPSSPVVALAGSVFVPDYGDYLKSKMAWLWLGRNGAQSGYTVLGDIAASVAFLGHNRYLIGSILPSAADTSGQLAALTALNASLAATYGTRYINILAALQAANDGSANDLADVAAGLVPRSLRSDDVHLNDAGYFVVAGVWVAATVAMGGGA